jgi:hypothetical protein
MQTLIFSKKYWNNLLQNTSSLLNAVAEQDENYGGGGRDKA